MHIALGKQMARQQPPSPPQPCFPPIPHASVQATRGYGAQLSQKAAPPRPSSILHSPQECLIHPTQLLLRPLLTLAPSPKPALQTHLNQACPSMSAADQRAKPPQLQPTTQAVIVSPISTTSCSHQQGPPHCRHTPGPVASIRPHHTTNAPSRLTAPSPPLPWMPSILHLASPLPKSHSRLTTCLPRSPPPPAPPCPTPPPCQA